MSLDFLKDVLGDDLFPQVAEKLKGSGITLANIADGSYIPKAKFDEQLEKVKTLQDAVSKRDETIKAEKEKNGAVVALQAQIDQLNKDVADRDAKIKGVTMEYRIKDELRGMKARNVDVIMPLLKRDTITEKDGKLDGLSEQVEALQKSDPYLFDSNSGSNRGGFDGNQNVGGSGGNNTNAMMNQALRAAAGRSV